MQEYSKEDIEKATTYIHENMNKVKDDEVVKNLIKAGTYLEAAAKAGATESSQKLAKLGKEMCIRDRDNMTIGVGAGQMNRVGAAKIAIEQAGEKAKGSVMSSDAFFPMPDTVEEAVKAGVTAIIQPGGSIKDQLSIDVCNEHDITMVYTGVRHFKH